MGETSPRPVRTAEVAVPLPLRTPLVYSLPEAWAHLVRPGLRVRVPVGRRTLTGFVWSLDPPAPEGVALRAVSALVDLEPPLPADLLELARFTADYYLAPIGEVLAAMLPQGLEPWKNPSLTLTAAGALAEPRDPVGRQIRDRLLERGRMRFAELRAEIPATDLPERLEELERAARVTVAGGTGSRYRTAYELVRGVRQELLDRCGRSPAGRDVVELLLGLGRPAGSDELAAAGASPAVLRRLARVGVLRRFSEPERLSLGRHLIGGSGPPRFELRPDQERALATIGDAVAGGRFARHLLQGVTGSGKTEVYLRAAELALARDRSAILLVPEIALVPALARSASERFGDRVALFHSGLASAERQQEWERIRSGAARIVVGPRSALFAPVERLGLLVIDEEQDLAYKQESSPRYQGRDLALVRCRDAEAVAVLVSATPSLEARLAADRGSLERLVLTKRAGSGRLPEGILVDLKRERGVPRPGELVFSGTLVTELERTLAEGDQAILLRNRRGYAPTLLCRACGEDFRCDDCGLPRTYHRRERRLLCHWCGSSIPAPELCPKCRAEALDPVGAGTERVEEEVRRRFPEARVEVLDRDASRRVGGAAAILERFRRGETDFLVGTQMLSKGHHFPRVATTAVLSADALLGFPDFRAVEKTYSLLTQIAGRAGRGERPGRVVIQTFLPDHYAIQAALRHDDAAFEEAEMQFRRAFSYPPYTRMVLLGSEDRDRDRARDRLTAIALRIARHPSAAEIKLSGPAPAPLERLRGRWRFQLLARSARGAIVRRAIADAIADESGTEITVDVDPYQML